MQAKTQWPNVVLGLIGIGTSSWAVHVHNLIKAGESSGCGITETISCDKVMASKWATVLGIPLGVYGLVFFAVVIISAIATKNTKMTQKQITLQNLGLATIGFLSSMGLMYISLALIKVACPVCMSTHTTTTLLFVFSLVAYLKAGKVE